MHVDIGQVIRAKHRTTAPLNEVLSRQDRAYFFPHGGWWMVDGGDGGVVYVKFACFLTAFLYYLVVSKWANSNFL